MIFKVTKCVWAGSTFIWNSLLLFRGICCLFMFERRYKQAVFSLLKVRILCFFPSKKAQSMCWAGTTLIWKYHGFPIEVLGKMRIPSKITDNTSKQIPCFLVLETCFPSCVFIMIYDFGARAVVASRDDLHLETSEDSWANPIKVPWKIYDNVCMAKRARIAISLKMWVSDVRFDVLFATIP